MRKLLLYIFITIMTTQQTLGCHTKTLLQLENFCFDIGLRNSRPLYKKKLNQQLRNVYYNINEMLTPIYKQGLNYYAEGREIEEEFRIFWSTCKEVLPNKQMEELSGQLRQINTIKGKIPFSLFTSTFVPKIKNDIHTAKELLNKLKQCTRT